MNDTPLQGFLDFTRPSCVPISHIDTRGWRRLSVATSRCIGQCSSCMCVRDLQKLARLSALEMIAFNVSGSPVLTSDQLIALRAKKEISTLNESVDTLDITVSIPPAPLQECRDDEL